MAVRLGGWMLLGALTLGIGIASLWAFRSETVVTEQMAVPRSAEEIRSQWRDAVQDVLAAYDGDKKPAVARDALLALRVTAEDQPLHLSLVLAFQRRVDGVAGAEQAIAKARASFATLWQQPSL
jgi:hypothetical protein